MRLHQANGGGVCAKLLLWFRSRSRGMRSPGSARMRVSNPRASRFFRLSLAVFS